jgi:hypothetical protein
MRTHTLILSTALLAAGGPHLRAQAYHVTHTYTLGGEGGWDYIALDTAGHRLFIARQDRVMVVDPASGKVLAEIPGLNRAHGIAFDYADGRGCATSGGDSSVVIFDLKTLQVLRRTNAAPDADANPLRPRDQTHLHLQRRFPFVVGDRRGVGEEDRDDRLGWRTGVRGFGRRREAVREPGGLERGG